ncbi:MAG: YbhN family protein [Actinomycetia bacterium]|nr:YbhN family protein [Actinomycetes bacterium]
MVQTAAEAAAKKRSVRRSIITSVIGLIIMGALFALLLPQLTSYEEAFSELRDIAWPWLVALAGSGILNIALYPLTVLVAIAGLGYWKGFVQRQSGFLVSNAIPGGGAIAVGTQYAILAHYRVRATLAAAAVGADSVFTYLITLGLPALAVTLLSIQGENASALTVTAAVIGAIVIVVSVILIVIVLRSDAGAIRVGKWGEQLTAPILRKFGKPVPDFETALVDFRVDAHDLMRRRWLALFVTNFIAQTTPFLVLVCALAGLGGFEHVNFVEVFAAYSIAIVLTSFPITPGGLGTVDAALIALLTSFGAPGSIAVAADLIWRLVWFLPQIIAGAVAMIVYIIARNRRRKHPDPVDADQ